jgi:hypothetical protein
VEVGADLADGRHEVLVEAEGEDYVHFTHGFPHYIGNGRGENGRRGA